MKKLGSIFFLLLYVFALYRPLVPLVDYVAQYSYYSEILCVNKDKPELACKGQCVLMQKIQKKAEQENPFNKIVISAEEEIPEILPQPLASFFQKRMKSKHPLQSKILPVEGHAFLIYPPPQKLS